MRDFGTLSLTALGTLLCTCGEAPSPTPDSSNPGQCIGAFHYARELALSEPNPDLALAVHSTGRALFEGKRMEVSGFIEEGQSESAAFLEAYSGGSDVLWDLVKGCTERQDSDPVFRSWLDSGKLTAAARKADPACRAEPACAGK